MSAVVELKTGLSIKLEVKAEHRAAFLTAIRLNQHGTLSTEKDARVYALGESTSTTNTFYLQEQYVGEGLAAHNASAHFAQWKEFVAAVEPFVSAPVVESFKEVKVDFDTSIVHKAVLEPAHKSFCVNVTFAVKAEKREVFLHALTECLRGTVTTETGVILYTVGQDSLNENILYVQEQYVDEAAFQSHAASPHFQQLAAVMNATDSPFTADPVLSLFKEV